MSIVMDMDMDVPDFHLESNFNLEEYVSKTKDSLSPSPLLFATEEETPRSEEPPVRTGKGRQRKQQISVRSRSHETQPVCSKKSQIPYHKRNENEPGLTEEEKKRIRKAKKCKKYHDSNKTKIEKLQCENELLKLDNKNLQRKVKELEKQLRARSTAWLGESH